MISERKILRIVFKQRCFDYPSELLHLFGIKKLYRFSAFLWKIYKFLGYPLSFMAQSMVIFSLYLFGYFVWMKCTLSLKFIIAIFGYLGNRRKLQPVNVWKKIAFFGV